MNILLHLYPGDWWAFLIASVLVQVTVVILVAWLVARLGSRWNAAWRHSIYLGALACVLASPMLTCVMQATGISLLTLRPSVPIALGPESPHVQVDSMPEVAMTEAPALPQPPQSNVTVNDTDVRLGDVSEQLSAADVYRAIGGMILVAWLLGIALLTVRWCYGLYLVARLRRDAEPLDCETMPELLDHVRQVLGTDKLPSMATSVNVDRPIMVGLIHPLVILPENLLRTLAKPELGDILVHESAHAVCRHQLGGLLQRLTGTLLWVHPLVHLLNRELARAREEVCDNYVIRGSDAPRYARTLLELSQLLVGVSPQSMALGLFHCRWKLEDRIADILDQRRRVMTKVNRCAALASTIMLLVLALLLAGTQAVPAASAADRKGNEESTTPSVPTAKSSESSSAVEQPPMDPELRQSATNLRNIMSAFHMYHDVAGHFPQTRFGYGYDRQKTEWFEQRPYLSWRVRLLPFLGEKELFAKFRTNEPWDSEHNRKLIPLMPKVYRTPGSKAGEGKTNYLGVAGPNAAFPDKGTLMYHEFIHGTSTTVMLVEVPDELAVEWSRPADFPVATKYPVKKLVGLRKGGFLTAFADGATPFISADIPAAYLQCLLTQICAEPVNVERRWVRFVQPLADTAVKPDRSVQ